MEEGRSEAAGFFFSDERTEFPRSSGSRSPGLAPRRGLRVPGTSSDAPSFSAVHRASSGKRDLAVRRGGRKTIARLPTTLLISGCARRRTALPAGSMYRRSARREHVLAALHRSEDSRAGSRIEAGALSPGQAPSTALPTGGDHARWTTGVRRPRFARQHRRSSCPHMTRRTSSRGVEPNAGRRTRGWENN